MIAVRALACLALAAAVSLTGARAQEPSKYPDWSGLWYRNNSVFWDPSKPPGRGQQAPLTEEYQKIFDARLAKQRAGTDANAVVSCLPPGMPRAMIVYEPMEIIIQPKVTHLLLSYFTEIRRVFTDGRDWPEVINPSFAGYSIGHWEDSDNNGRFDTLVAETRGIKGPRTFDSRGIPLHEDNETVVKERITLDKAHKDVLQNEITVIDHALTRAWTVQHSYKRVAADSWEEYVCAEDNHQVVLGGENYMIGGDGKLMPTRKDQSPPDLSNFGPRK